MKTLLTLFLLLFSSVVSSFDNKKVLFENEVYRLSLNYNNNCEKLNLFDKKTGKIYLF
ncbi:hypothetical protein [Rodentibacter pneumotropicus]|uniref:hypothetical protein n=1 Tax=Rodentibacter pneumotropicus TaxID=758 RepID=UPI001F60AABD|nr:hypothetical protein [Rodentibacter pneumotropicus]